MAELFAQAGFVVEVAYRPKYGAALVGCTVFAQYFGLLHPFGKFARAHQFVHTHRHECRAAEMPGGFAPPWRQDAEVGAFETNAPIHLRGNVVNHFALQPSQWVGEDAVVLPVASRSASVHPIFICQLLTGARHTGWRNAIAHPRLHLLNHGVHCLYHAVYIIAAPVAKTHSGAGILPRFVVGGGNRRGYAFRIEVIVVENAVHIIFGDHFAAHTHDAIDGPLLRRVENVEFAPVQQVLFGFGIERMAPSGADAEAVGINPSMDFHTSLMTFAHSKCQRVVARIFAAGAGQIARPWLEA